MKTSDTSIKNNPELILAEIKSYLPTLMNQCTYDEYDRMFQTPKYATCCAAYYQGVRLSDKIAVIFDLADGTCRRFLNGVSIYGSDGKGGTKLLAYKRFPMYGGVFWSERVGRSQAVQLLTGYVQNQCILLGLGCPNMSKAEAVAEVLVDETVVATEKLGKMMLSSGGSQKKSIGW